MQNWLGEFIFPFLGLVFWEWSFSFILYFYVIDLLAKWIFIQIRFLSRSVEINRKVNIKYSLLILLELLFLGAIFFLSEIQFFNSIKEFVLYKEMGIPVGVLLIPIVFLGEYMKMRTEIKMKSNQQKMDFIVSNQISINKLMFWVILVLLMAFNVIDKEIAPYLFILTILLAYSILELKERVFSSK